MFARGLNLVVLTVGLQPRWGGMTISIPVNLRLHRKDGPTMLALAAEMMAELVSWFPSTRFVLCGDGAYATLAGNHLERTAVVSRMRRDAALYEAPPSRTNRRGRPRKKGARLDTPVQLAKAATSCQEVEVDWRGHKVTKLLSRGTSYGTGSARTLWCASSSCATLPAMSLTTSSSPPTSRCHRKRSSRSTLAAGPSSFATAR